MEDVDFESNKHVGLNNIRYRIDTMCHGDITVNSKIDEGTEVIVTFAK